VPPSLPVPGDVVDEKYAIERLLGKGGMGIVFEARHKKLGQRVAIKFLLPGELERPDAVARFDREARAAALLRSQHAVRVLDVDQTSEGLPYIVMEYLEGHDVGTELRARPRIPLPEAVDWVLQTCVAMAEAHGSGIVHRDLKPSNLFLTTAAHGPPLLKVMDFGISKLLAVEEQTELTSTETTLGTPSYMAPEQLVSAKTITPRADVWSLGVILYRLVAGQLPFQAPNPTALAIAIATEPPMPLAVAAPWVPKEIVDTVMAALERDPARRIPDVITFGRRIEKLGTGTFKFAQAIERLPPARGSDPAVRAGATSPMEQTLQIGAEGGPTASSWEGKLRASSGATPPPKSHALVWVGVGLAAAALVVGGTASVYVARTSRQRPSPPVAVASTPPPAAEPTPSAAPPEPPPPLADPSTSAPSASVAARPPPRPRGTAVVAASAAPPPPSPKPSATAKPAGSSDPLHL
jgi:serine/threonine-protein kinase